MVRTSAGRSNVSRITRWRLLMGALLWASTPVAAQDTKQIDSLYVARDTAALEQAIAGALKAHPQDAMIHFTVQRIRLEQERYAEAVASGRTVVERADPSLAGMRGWAGVRMGIAAFMLDDRAAAGEALR